MQSVVLQKMLLFTSISVKIFIKDSRAALYYAEKLCSECCLCALSIQMYNVLHTQTLQAVAVGKAPDDFLKRVFDFRQ